MLASVLGEESRSSETREAKGIGSDSKVKVKKRNKRHKNKKHIKTKNTSRCNACVSSCAVHNLIIEQVEVSKLRSRHMSTRLNYETAAHRLIKEETDEGDTRQEETKRGDPEAKGRKERKKERKKEQNASRKKTQEKKQKKTTESSHAAHTPRK